jgi:uncharacterized membrane protein
MTHSQKYARFQLAVAALAGAAVLVVYLLSHNLLGSMAGFAFLALLGLRPSFMRRPVEDERDEAIHRRAATAAHTVLWLALVVWGVSVTLAYDDRGSVPLPWVAPVVWVAWWLVTAVRSITILVLDRGGAQ